MDWLLIGDEPSFLPRHLSPFLVTAKTLKTKKPARGRLYENDRRNFASPIYTSEWGSSATLLPH